MRSVLAVWAMVAAIGPVQAQSSAQELAEAAAAQRPRGFTKGLAEVVRGGAAAATLLLSGVPETVNSGDDMAYGMDFSGIYEASADAGQWKLGRQIPLDDLGQIVSQRLAVALRPGQGVDVEDRMRVRVQGGNGFAARLNYRARLQPVRKGEAEVRSRFGGGLLWLDLPPGEAELTLRYSIDVETSPKDPNSGCFTADYGHIRNQYFWHPMFGFSTAGDHADFEVEVRAPADYQVVTSLPQTARVEGAERIIEARSVRKVFALSLAYDRGWKVESENISGIRLELFVTPEFRPAPATVVEKAREVHAVLAGRFGQPGSGYIAVVQLRAQRGNGWHFNSNQAFFADGSPGDFSAANKKPFTDMAHEIGHFWTSGSGPAANFLQEGWATYVESLLLEHEYGREAVPAFWKQHARSYFDHYDGKAAMWGSENSSDLNYDKGGWVFRMLEGAVGRDAFGKAMTEFSRRSLAGAAGWETLAECLDRQKVAEFDAAQFLLPWLKETRAPRLRAQAEGRTVTVVEDGPAFVLPVTVEGTTARGTERHRVWVRGELTEVQFSDAVSGVRIDPDELLLLRR
jgi:hypothetical protein